MTDRVLSILTVGAGFEAAGSSRWLQVVGGVQLRLQGAGVMTIIAVLPAVVENTLISRVCAWERRLSGPRRTLAAAQLWKRS